MIQVRNICCGLLFLLAYYISSTSDQQALDPGVWGPCINPYTHNGPMSQEARTSFIGEEMEVQSL